MSRSNTEKVVITAKCQRFIDEVLKPRFLPAIRPTQFNYPIDILGKWNGNRYRFVQPFAPGGSTDASARIVGQHLPRILGQSVVIENRAGAAGSLGAKAVASAEPDGYTLLWGNISTLVVLPVVTNNRDYDPARQFVPIAKVMVRL